MNYELRTMNKRLGLWMLILSISLLCASLASAQVPRFIRYQGQALDSQGVPLEGPYTLTFHLYDASTGGNKLWEETQANVPLKNGYFSILLGQVKPLDAMEWAEPCWLSVQVNTEPELAPRQQITSVPLALRASVAETLTTPVTTSTITDDANRLVQSGTIVLWKGTACPVGYSRVSDYDNLFLVGSSTAGTTGGSNSHDHGGVTGVHVLTINEIPPHTHGLRGHASAGGPGSNWFPNLSDPVFTTTESAGGGAGHTHTISPADSRPAFKTILLCQKD